MCLLLNVTPKQLGKLRDNDPVGMTFMERTYLYRREKENEAYKKQEAEAKRRASKGRRH